MLLSALFARLPPREIFRVSQSCLSPRLFCPLSSSSGSASVEGSNELFLPRIFSSLSQVLNVVVAMLSSNPAVWEMVPCSLKLRITIRRLT